MILTLLVGKFLDINVPRLINSYKSKSQVVVSTWSDQVTDDQIKMLKEANFDLVLNDNEEMKCSNENGVICDISINLQLKTIQAGLKFIRENYDCEIIIKSRTDIYPLNYDKFLDYVSRSSLHEINKLSVLFSVNINFLYYLDLIVVGKKEDIFKFFSAEYSFSHVYPELHLIHHYSGEVPSDYSYEYYEKYLNFIGNRLKELDIDFIWERNKENFNKMPMNFLIDYNERIRDENYSVFLIRDFCQAPYITC